MPVDYEPDGVAVRARGSKHAVNAHLPEHSMNAQPQPLDLDNMSVEELVDLNERVQKKLNEKIAAEKAELEKRQAAIAKLEERIKKGPQTKPAARPKTDAKTPGKVGEKDGKDAAREGSSEPGGSAVEGQTAPAAGEGPAEA